MMMREYILTEKERKVLIDHLEKGTKGNHFYVLVHRLRNYYDKLKCDFKLIEEVLALAKINKDVKFYPQCGKDQ
jgi:hypothetical protein